MGWQNPGELIWVDVAGKRFKCSRRTYAHITDTTARTKKKWPNCTFEIIQPCYNTTIAASAGTHDYDAVFDVEIHGVDWWQAQHWLRDRGWAAWYRHTGTWAAQDAWHIHMISLGYPGKVGEYIDGGKSLYGYVKTSSQVLDYYHHTFGLKGQHISGADHSYFPANINATIFSYPRWLSSKEDDMAGFSDWSDADKKAFGAFIQDQVRATLITVDTDGDGKSVDTHLGAIMRSLVSDVNAIQKKVGA